MLVSPNKGETVVLKKRTLKIEIGWNNIAVFLRAHGVRIGIAAAVIVAAIIAVWSLRGQAETVFFYPETCLGGWRNVQNAQNEPDLAWKAQPEAFTDKNSAVLENVVGSIYCGEFSGSLPEQSVITSVRLKPVFALKPYVPSQEEPEATSTLIQIIIPDESVELPASDEPSATSTSEENSGEPPAETTEENSQAPPDTGTKPDDGNQNSDIPQSEQPTSETATTSSLQLLPLRLAEQSVLMALSAHYAYAQEEIPPPKSLVPQEPARADGNDVAEQILQEDSDMSSTEKIATTSESDTSNTDDTGDAVLPVPTSSEETDNVPSPVSFLEVAYSLDGEVWTLLGSITEDNWKDELVFDILPLSLEKLRALQVHIGTPEISDMQLLAYLDGMILEVEYETISEEGKGIVTSLIDKIISDDDDFNQPIETADQKEHITFLSGDWSSSDISVGDDFLIDPSAQHACRIEPFSQSVQPGSVAGYIVILTRSNSFAPFRVVAGDTSPGVTASLKKGDAARPDEVLLELAADENTQEGSFGVVISVQEQKVDGSVSCAVCQLNLIVQE